MSLTIYALLLLLSFIILWLSYEYDAPVFRIVGLFFLFVLGLTLLNGDLRVVVGENKTLCDYQDTYIYGDNFTGVHWDYADDPTPKTGNDIYVFHVNRSFNGCVESKTKLYDNVTDSWVLWIGRIMALMSALGIIIFFATGEFKGGRS